MNVFVFLLIGAVAGWLAGVVVRGRGFGIIADIIVGIIGAWIGGKLIGTRMAITNSRNINELIVATLGAIILVIILRLFSGRR